LPPPRASQLIANNANEVLAFQFELNYSTAVGHVGSLQSGTMLGARFNCGLYDVNGNLLVDSGAFDGLSSSYQCHAMTTPVPLPAGI